MEAEHFPDIQFSAFSSILGGLWGRAAGSSQPLACSQLGKIIGAGLGEHTRLTEMFGGICGTGGVGYTALIKKKKRF